MIGYRFVHDHRADFTVTDLCRNAKVSRSGFYAWLARPAVTARTVDDARIVEAITDIWELSRRTYGRPRILGQLRRRGVRIGTYRLRRLMTANSIEGVTGRKKWRQPSPNASRRAGPDLLNRDFTAERSDERWVADISEFGCCDGKLYLAGIVDLCDRGFCGWSMGEHQSTDLVIGALVMALTRRQPEGDLVHHADHGTQYTSIEFTNRLVEWGLIASYGSIGDCYDNAAMESTWATIKREIEHIWGPINTYTRSQMRTIIFEYIETFYNTNRHQARLGHRTPSEVYAAHQAA